MAHTKHKTAIICLFVLVLTSFLPLFDCPVFAANDVEILYFYETGCVDCEELEEFLEERLRLNYPVIIRRYEIHKPDNANLMLRLVEEYDAEEIREKGTPAVFVGDKAFQGSSLGSCRTSKFLGALR